MKQLRMGAKIAEIGALTSSNRTLGDSGAILYFFLLKGFVMSKKTLVLGASENPARYGNKAIYALRRKGHEVVAIGKRKGQVLDVDIDTEMKPMEDIDTVTLYLNPMNQEPYLDYILSLKPKRIIFNPGTENFKLEALAEDAGIQPLEACTLVLLSIGRY
jgi:predicted CoA-binding protein